MEWKIGMKVMFGRNNGQKTLGEIVKVNPKKLKVKQLEQRGVQKNHSVGSVWTVPRSLCTPVDQKHMQRPVATKRSDSEIIEELRQIECGLSPENLSCDGEASRTHVRRTYIRLNKRKAACIRELGREPTFDEMWR